MNYFDEFQQSIACNRVSLQEFIGLFETRNSGMLNILNYNVRSFNANSRYFLPVLIEKAMPAIFIASETWFNHSNRVDLHGYDSYHTIRTERQSGGVSIYVIDSFNSRKIDALSFSNNDIELCTVEIKVDNDLIYFFGIYRPHSGTIDGFISELTRVIQNPMFDNKRCCMAGDMNINLLIESNDNRRYIEFLQSYHYFPVITEATRYSPDNNHSPSLLDHIWVNTLNLFNSGVVNYDTLDHLPTFLQIPLPECTKVNDYIKISFRLNTEVNRETYRQLISDFDWSSIISSNVNDYLQKFIETIDSLYCSTFPLKTKHIPRKKAMNPWFSSELTALVNQKSIYFELFRLGIVSKQENNLFKNRVKACINKAKCSYYKKIFDDCFGNMKETWKNLNILMGRSDKKPIKSIITDSGECFDDFGMAEIFNRYFANVPLDLDANVPHSHLDPVTFIRNDITSLLTEFSPCTATEVSSIMSDHKITKVGLNSAPNSLIVTNRDIFATTICDVINKSLLCGIFPDVLKRGQITPIHKKSCNKTPANYRPITISPFLGKVFEKNIYARMIEHINANDILSAHQFGFRKHMSTLDAIIHLTEFIYDALNGKKSNLNILIDYSRTFDTVNHETLLNKFYL